ncbi:ABC transporter transmembrane region [Ceratobasidium sp. AG-Ba]|nr:ABC transporter transmembrane region [Ceratobasidium sp. AG-Ba]
MLAIVPPVSLGAFAYGRYLKRLSNRTQEGLGEMSKVANEALSAARTVQAFTAAPREQDRFAAKVDLVQSLAIKEARASAAFFGTTGWAGNVIVLGLLGYGGSLVSSGQISVGDLTSLLMYTAYVGGSLSMLSRPGAEILRGFSMAIRGKGDSVAIVGKSGSGKSSIQSLLFRFYDPDSGCITVNGHVSDIRQFSVDSWRSAIGIVPQDPVLFTGTISETLPTGAQRLPSLKLKRRRDSPTVISFGRCRKNFRPKVSSVV